MVRGGPAELGARRTVRAAKGCRNSGNADLQTALIDCATGPPCFARQHHTSRARRCRRRRLLPRLPQTKLRTLYQSSYCKPCNMPATHKTAVSTAVRERAQCHGMPCRLAATQASGAKLWRARTAGAKPQEVHVYTRRLLRKPTGPLEYAGPKQQVQPVVYVDLHVLPYGEPQRRDRRPAWPKRRLQQDAGVREGTCKCRERSVSDVIAHGPVRIADTLNNDVGSGGGGS